MTRRLFISLVLASFIGATTSSCLIHTHGRSKRAIKSKKVKKSRKCPPSHYWDGKKCRHKGKGKGARKHDH
jgi:hypothetical protein